MYRLEIDFQTEKERVELTRGKFVTPEEACVFAIDFVKPYITDCQIADGEWKVYDSKNPEFIARHYPIKSLRSIRAVDKLK